MLRKTKSERKVLNALQKLNCATAEDIHSEINKEHKIGLTSVYRALKRLEKSCEVKPVNFYDGRVHYDLNSKDDHHHHFVCTLCNRVEVIRHCPFEAIKQQLGEDFEVQSHNFELFGLCGECKKEEALASS